MSRIAFTGVGKALWVPDPTGAGALVSLTAPSVATLSTGVPITGYMRRDGMSTPMTGSTIDISDAGSRKNKQGIGTYGGDKATLKLYRDAVLASDTMWPLFAQGLYGFLVVFRFGMAGATPAVADRATDIFHCGVSSRANTDVAENDPQAFTAELAILDWNDNGIALIA